MSHPQIVKSGIGADARRYTPIEGAAAKGSWWPEVAAVERFISRAEGAEDTKAAERAEKVRRTKGKAFCEEAQGRARLVDSLMLVW